MTGPLKHVVVLAGGISHERDVSLRSGRRVADSLLEHGLTVELRDPDARLLAGLRAERPDVIWPALHGASGEDGALRGLLEFLGIPFVGSRSDAARLAWDKPVAKIVVSRAGVATPRSITLPRDAFRELGADAVFEAIADELPVPLVVKPAKAPAPKAPLAPPLERASMLSGRSPRAAWSLRATSTEETSSNSPPAPRVRTPNARLSDSTSSAASIGSCGPSEAQPARSAVAYYVVRIDLG